MKSFMIKCLGLAGTSLMLVLTGCQDLSSDVYTTSASGVQKETAPGVIVSARDVTVQNKGNLGMIVGGVAGGIAGSNIGGGSRENALGAIGVGLLGGLAGREIEKAATRQAAREYVVQLDSGHTYTVVQGPEPRLVEGQQVFVQWASGDRARVIARY